MPQIDCEPLPPVSSGGSDWKIACETLADELGDLHIPDTAVVDYPQDFPPESFWLSKDAVFDWFDRNAFLERKESIKGNFNSMNLNPNANSNFSNANSSSVQFSAFLKSKAAIISLPNSQKTKYVDSKRRNCKLANILLFPKRLDSIGKEPAVVSMAEPSSPKVSCLGKVRSKGCPRRRKLRKQAKEPEKISAQGKTVELQKTSFMCCIKSLFRFDRHGVRTPNKSPLKLNEPSEYSVPRKAAADPADLGVMTRFSSGRRPETWSVTEMLT